MRVCLPLVGKSTRPGKSQYSAVHTQTKLSPSKLCGTHSEAVRERERERERGINYTIYPSHHLYPYSNLFFIIAFSTCLSVQPIPVCL